MRQISIHNGVVFDLGDGPLDVEVPHFITRRPIEENDVVAPVQPNDTPHAEPESSIMTVQDLITCLHQFPSDLPVLVEGYETGWDGIVHLVQDDVQLSTKAQEWDGEFKKLTEFSHPTPPGKPAVLIVGKRCSFR